MKTFSDLIDYVGKSLDYAFCNECYSSSCDTCTYNEHCFIDSMFLALDYLYRGEYYG